MTSRAAGDCDAGIDRRTAHPRPVTERSTENTEPPAAGIALAILVGDLAEVERLLAEHPGLAAERIRGRKGGTGRRCT